MTKPVTTAMALQRILRRLQRAADEAFDPKTAMDSDGLDQAEREAYMRAQEIVREEFQKVTTF